VSTVVRTGQEDEKEEKIRTMETEVRTLEELSSQLFVDLHELQQAKVSSSFLFIKRR
jgi:hypothetical protein